MFSLLGSHESCKIRYARFPQNAVKKRKVFENRTVGTILHIRAYITLFFYFLHVSSDSDTIFADVLNLFSDFEFRANRRIENHTLHSCVNGRISIFFTFVYDIG